MMVSRSDYSPSLDFSGSCWRFRSSHDIPDDSRNGSGELFSCEVKIIVKKKRLGINRFALGAGGWFGGGGGGRGGTGYYYSMFMAKRGGTVVILR